jgi:hypothetical protein
METTTMTTFQRIVLHTLFADTYVIRFAGAWVFKQEIMRDRDLAALIYWNSVRELD